jgi:hypothetical protein
MEQNICNQRNKFFYYRGFFYSFSLKFGKQSSKDLFECLLSLCSVKAFLLAVHKKVDKQTEH